MEEISLMSIYNEYTVSNKSPKPDIFLSKVINF